ncbi:polymeric immunoglobulin receptor-like [Pagrus major]|uniref:polymeric immunoglobulin receptor-like n=1 Tax=Pagrus major TaxID=143350 RepID=UPI003CC869D8
MKIHHVLFFCFISALCGDTGLVSAKFNIYTGAEGGSGSMSCYLSQPKNTKFFCKEECKAEDILVKTEDVRAQNGRFSTEYEVESSGRGVLTVTITDLTKSDAGRYRCGSGTDLVPDSYSDFEIRVSDELPGGSTRFFRTDTEGENITMGCLDTVQSEHKFLCKDKCETEEDIIIETDANRAKSGRYSIEYKEGSIFGLYVTITNASKLDTGWYKCGYGRALSPDSSRRLPILVIPDPSKPNQTPPPFSTSVPSASTPTTQSLKLSSESVIASSSFPKTTNQPSAADLSKPNQTPPPFSTSAPSASTPTTQSLKLSSESVIASSSFPKTTNQPSAAVCSSVPHPGYIWGLVVLLVVVFLLILYTWKMRRDFRSSFRITEIPFL